MVQMTEELRAHLLRNVQTGCGSNPASYSVGIEGGGGVKWLGSEADHTPSSAFKNEWHYTLTPPHVQGLQHKQSF